MRLNLPHDFLWADERVLLAGIGSGYDIYATIPFAHDFDCDEKSQVFVGFGNKAKTYIDESFLPAISDMIAAPFLGEGAYFLEKMGVIPYAHFLHGLVGSYGIQAVLLCDGGFDSIMVGDEEAPGTILEDMVSLAAYSQLNIPVYLSCMGLGTEVEEGIDHYRVLENMAALSEGLVGSFGLTPHHDGYHEYKRIYESVAKGASRPSHIHSRVIMAAEGGFGEIEHDPSLADVFSPSDKKPFISPLMNQVWIYDAAQVVARSPLVSLLKKTATWTDVIMIWRQYRNELQTMRARKEFVL